MNTIVYFSFSNNIQRKYNFTLKDRHENCDRCSANCAYEIDDLLNEKVGQLKLNEELSLHGHPKTRHMDLSKRQRTTKEGIQELIEHYKFSHDEQ